MASFARELLAPLQHEFLRLFFSEPRTFFLTDGTALGAFYLGHRRSRDIDLFSTDDAAFSECGAQAEETARSMSLAFRWDRVAPTFRRLVGSRGEGSLIVDFVRDTDHQIVRDKPLVEGISVDSLDDIAANKLCALVGRKEVRDWIDLYFLAQSGRDLVADVALAQQKDGGVKVDVLAWIAGSVRVEQVSGLVVKPVTPEQINAFFQELARRFAQAAFPG